MDRQDIITAQVLIEKITRLLQSTSKNQPYMDNALNRIETAIKKYKEGKFVGTI